MGSLQGAYLHKQRPRKKSHLLYLTDDLCWLRYWGYRPYPSRCPGDSLRHRQWQSHGPIHRLHPDFSFRCRLVFVAGLFERLLIIGYRVDQACLGTLALRSVTRSSAHGQNIEKWRASRS